MNNEINEKLKTLPEKSGVYIMRNAEGGIIYVGKAKNLKNRVRSYFKSKNHAPKVESMVNSVDTFEYIITDSELEALVLENNLIKENMPKYNILLKDDKTYPFLKITINEAFPRLFLTRRILKDGALYYGPYQSSSNLKQLIALVNEIYSLKSCSKDFTDKNTNTRACLYYQLGRCKGVCNGSVSREEYGKLIKKAIAFINGNTAEAKRELQEQMISASNSYDFERAAICRDRLRAIDVLGERQKIVTPKGTDSDAIAIYNANNMTCVQLFFIRTGKIIGREHYFLNDTDGIRTEEILSEFIRLYYEDATFIPGTIYIETEIEDAEVLEKWITSRAKRSVRIKVPKIGDKLKLINMIKANAKKEHSEKELKTLRDIRFKNSALNELGNILGLESPPMYIEAYDISNLGDNTSVASMVVYKNGKPHTKKYRNFKIKTVVGQDDYASVQEVIKRRTARALSEQQAVDEGRLNIDDASFLPLPDVIFADGGTAHRNVVKEALGKIDIPVFGIVKDNNHKTRGLVGEDGEIYLDRKSDAFMLITNIQDEMHRRAITYLRKSQQKKNIGSELENIPGVGPKKRKALLMHFKSLASIKRAKADEIASVKGIDMKTAENIVKFFEDNK